MKLTPTDHALAAFKAALNLIPLVGGSISSLVGDYVPLSTQAALEKAAELLREKLAHLEGRIDTEAVNKEDFAELFKSCELVITRTNREEKLRAAVNLLANLLLKPGDGAKVPYEELDHLVHCLDKLSIGAVFALGAARQIPDHLRGFSFSELRSKFPSYEPALIIGLVAELRALHLVHVQEGAIQLPDYETYRVTVTPMGARFAERFIEGRM